MVWMGWQAAIYRRTLNGQNVTSPAGSEQLDVGKSVLGGWKCWLSMHRMAAPSSVASRCGRRKQCSVRSPDRGALSGAWVRPSGWLWTTWETAFFVRNTLSSVRGSLCLINGDAGSDFAADGYNVSLIRRGCLWQDGEQQLFWFTQSSFQSHTKNVEQANMFSAMHAPKADHGELKKRLR